jgi:uncharacterized OB-fold protein
MSIHPEKQYRDFLAQGRFMLQRARQSGRFIFYPRVAEPGTGDTDLEWVEASGRGTIYSATRVRGRDPAADASIVLVDLVEGPRMMSQVIGIAPDQVRIGMAVQATIVTRDDAPLLVFEAAGSAA